MDGKEERIEERDSMADLVLDRESNDMEGACSEVGVEVEDGVVGRDGNGAGRGRRMGSSPPLRMDFSCPIPAP